MASEEIGSFVGSFAGSGSGVGTAVLIALGIVFVGGLLAGGVAWLINWLSYNKKVKLFRKVGNEIVPIITDRAKFERVGTAGDYWCKTKQLKKTLPRPRKQMAKNEFWFYEREDGEWINFSLGDFDGDMKKAGAYFVDEDMRLQRLGIQKNLRDRFQKVTFWQKYGGMIMSAIFVLIITICLVILFKEMKENWAVGKEMASAVRDMAVQVANLQRQTGSGAEFIVESFLPLVFLKGVFKR